MLGVHPDAGRAEDLIPAQAEVQPSFLRWQDAHCLGHVYGRAQEEDP
jgi:hypothetical protein